MWVVGIGGLVQTACQSWWHCTVRASSSLEYQQQHISASKKETVLRNHTLDCHSIMLFQ